MKTNEQRPHNWKGHIMITFLKVIFTLTQVCGPRSLATLAFLSYPRVDVHVVSVGPPDELLLLVLEAEHGLGAAEGAAQLVLRELLLPDVCCRGAVTRSVKRMSVPRVLHTLWCHLPNIFNLCNCFNSSTSLNRRSRSSCFLRFQRDLGIKVQDNNCQMRDEMIHPH